MSVSYVEDEDVLQLLTGDDEFDAEIDEDAEEELLRDDVINYGLNNRQIDSIHGSQECDDFTDNQINKTIASNQSIDDEEEDEDRDSGRERFKSERIMSLASVPTRRREIPDSLDSINVNLNDNKTDKKNYNNNNNNNNNNNSNNRRYNQQKFRQNNNSNNNNNNNNNNSVIDFNRNNNKYRSNQGLLPLPLINNLMPQHIQHQTQQQQRMLLIQPNIYGQQFQPQINNNNSVHNIHVNPHFRARVGPQFEQLSQVFRPQEPVRIPNVLMQSRPQYPQQNSQQMLINQQIRPHFMGNSTLFNDQNMPQMTPQSQQPLIPHPSQSHQMQMENQWRNQNIVQSSFQTQQHLGAQQLIPQQMPVNRQQLNSTQMFNTPQPTQQPFPNNSFNQNFQSNNNVFIPSNSVQHSLQSQTNNFNNQYSIEAQRFPIQPNFNPMQFQNQTPFQPQPNQQFPNYNNNISPQIHQRFRAEVPQRQRLMKPINQQKRVNTQSQQGLRINKPLIGTNDQQKIDALKAAQMKTKRAKQILTKKAQNVREVTIVKSPIVCSVKPKITETVKKVNAEIEASVGVDEEYKKKMEEQKRLREEILRKKEERRKAMAAQRLKDVESNTVLLNSRVSVQKVSQTRNQPQQQQTQQIATLLNRSPQLQNRFQPKQAPKRIVRPINETLSSNSSIKVINTNQKRSVLIKGLASSTTELTIRKLCKSVGVIESCKIVISGGQKNAIVTFIRSQDAILFQSKHEHTLLDLSIIQVSLIWFVFINFFNNYSNDNYIVF